MAQKKVRIDPKTFSDPEDAQVNAGEPYSIMAKIGAKVATFTVFHLLNVAAILAACAGPHPVSAATDSVFVTKRSYGDMANRERRGKLVLIPTPLNF